MLASGQIALDLKRKYVSDNTTSAGAKKDIPIPESYQPNPNLAPTPPPPISTEPETSEDHFKTVRNTLLLNQSAMLPKDPQPQKPASKPSEKTKTEIVDEKLGDLAKKSDTVLLKVSTVFPFTFFLNDIIIDPYKVTIIFREFFWSEHIHSIMIKDILDVVVESSVFFATIKIVDQGYVENTVDITYLKKEDALKVRKIIQGLVIAHRQAVDLSVLPKDSIQEKTQELGKVKGIDDSISIEPSFG